MGILALLLLIALASKGGGTRHPTGFNPEPAHPVAKLHHRAREANKKAAATGQPADLKAAAQASADAHAATQQAKAVSPSPVPAGLPAFPAGWTFANPPPSAVVARANQLLPILWARGPGATSTEQTGGSWFTYQAAATSPGKKGVIAYKPKPGTLPITVTPGRSMLQNA
jgi:hypothetical protein